LVERDSVALWWYTRARRPGVDFASFDAPMAAALHAQFAARGRDLTLLDLTSDLGIPAFAAVSRRRQPPEQILFGCGAHLDARVAALRAITELHQMLQRVGAADRGAAGAHVKNGDSRMLAEWLERETIREHPFLAADPTQPARTAASF